MLTSRNSSEWKSSLMVIKTELKWVWAELRSEPAGQSVIQHYFHLCFWKKQKKTPKTNTKTTVFLKFSSDILRQINPVSEFLRETVNFFQKTSSLSKHMQWAPWKLVKKALFQGSINSEYRALSVGLWMRSSVPTFWFHHTLVCFFLWRCGVLS